MAEKQLSGLYIAALLITSTQQNDLDNSTFVCGFCKEDKGAAVYSYKNKQLAQEKNNKYVVVEILGLSRKEQVPQISQVLKSIQGILSHTVKVSYEQKSASFVYDQKITLAKIISEVSKRLDFVKIQETEDIA